jgi:hypothetical protein
MDILTPFVVLVLAEVVLYGFCCWLCREKRLPNDPSTQFKIAHHQSPLHPLRSPQGLHPPDHQKAWTHANDRPSNRPDNKAPLVRFSSHISSLRDCE